MTLFIFPFYDGNDVGAFIGDASRRLSGYFTFRGGHAFTATGPFSIADVADAVYGAGNTMPNQGLTEVSMNLNTVWPVSNEFRPASLSIAVYMRY